jgi:hypothetical protein
MTRAFFRGDNAPRRIDVHRNLFLGVLRLKKQKLGDDEGGHVVLDRARHKDDPLLEEARIDVVSPLAAAGLLDHHGHEQVHVLVCRVLHSVLWVFDPNQFTDIDRRSPSGSEGARGNKPAA